MWKSVIFQIFRYIFPVLLLVTSCVKPPAPPLPPTVPPEVPPPKVAPLTPVSWDAVEGWPQDQLEPAFAPFIKSCRVLKNRPEWVDVCTEAETLDGSDGQVLRNFFTTRFVPWQVRNPDGSDTGTITGYYIPDLHGSRTRSARYAYPLYGVPNDLLVIDLRSLYPELGDYRLRGRLEGRRIIPYWTRGDIEQGKGNLQGHELFWVDDPVELFFLHIQGSGRILLDTGGSVMVGYGDQNGHPYRSIGKLLIDRGEMTKDQMSMQNIRCWAQKHPDKVKSLLAENPSYVFFEERSSTLESPPGALGVPLAPGRSLAVDPRFIPLGAPVFLATSWPSSHQPLQRLMVAQDTGGAIKGAVRADFFWGLGDTAENYAGRMKQEGRLWVLLPKDFVPSQGTK